MTPMPKDRIPYNDDDDFTTKSVKLAARDAKRGYLDGMEYLLYMADKYMTYEGYSAVMELVRSCYRRHKITDTLSITDDWMVIEITPEGSDAVEITDEARERAKKKLQKRIEGILEKW